tara:strand:- start:1535 stop:3673 length:2139 start_codon:yes stop_codon:yes gene_type:complete
MRKLLLLLFFGILTGQDVSISGLVVDSETNNPIIDANIFVPDSDFGAATDYKGNFKIENLENKNYTIIASALGYKDSIVTITSESNLIIKLVPSSIMGAALEVIGRYPSKHTPNFTDNITRDIISEQKSQTLSELFRNVLGIDVQMEHNVGRNANVSIRGSSDYKPGGYNNRVLVLLDGFQMSIPNSGSVDWNGMPLEFIDRVEVLKGPMSSLYGQNSMGGVINLVTKKFKNEFSTLKASYGTFNSKDLDVGLNRNINDNLSLQTLFQYKEGDGHRFNSQFRQNNIYLKLSKPESNLTTSIIVNKSYTGQPGFDRVERPSLISYRLTNRDSIYLQFFKRFKFKNNQDLDYSFSVNHFYTHYRDRKDVPDTEVEPENFYNDLSVNTRIEYQWLINNDLYFLAGDDIIFEQSEISVFNDSFENPWQITHGIFGRLKYQVNPKLSLAAGIRHDFRTVKPADNFSYINFSSFSPKFNMQYIVDDKSNINLSVSKGFRAPSFSELFLKYSTSYGLVTQGNANLNPEELFGIDLAYNFNNLENFKFSVNPYYYVYNDMIDFVYAIPVIARNRTDVNSMGFETKFNFVFDNINFDLGYTFLKVDDMNDLDPMFYRPKHKIVAKTSLDQRLIRHSFLIKYQSEQDYQDFLSDDYDFSGNEIKFPVNQLDGLLLADYVAMFKFKTMDLSLKIANIFDVEYELIQDYPMPGRMISLNYEMKF